MSQLANLLETHAEALVRRWIEEVRTGLAPEGKTEPELRDHIPDFLRELMAALRRGTAPEKSTVAAAHGRQRYGIGFDVDALVREYGLLRGNILDLIEETGCPMVLQELRILSDFIATAIAEAVREHGRQQQHAESTLAQAHIQALRESEARYRTVFEFIDDGFCLMQLLFDAEDRPVDYRFLEANAAFEAHTGLRGAVGRTARELVPDLDASWFQLYGKVALTGETARFENHAPAMGRWFEAYASRVGRPELRQVALVFKDVTERKTLLAREQAAWQEAEAERQKLLDLFAQAPVAIAIHEGREHTFTFANPAFRALVGGRDVVGRSLLEALPELRGQGFEAVLDRVVATGEPFVGNELPVRLDRTGRGTPAETFFNVVYSPKRNARGQVEGVVQCAYDVTEHLVARRRAEALAEKLRESEERLRRVVEASGTGTWELDVATETLVTDPRFRELFGLSADEPFSLPKGLSLIHPEDSPRVAKAVTEALAGGNGGRYLAEYRIGRILDGRERWVEARGQAQFGPDGKPVRVLGTGVDITARKDAEASREELLAEAVRGQLETERLRALEKERAEFEQQLIGIVSHDLRNPLSAILLSTTALARREELDERTTKAVMRIQASADRSVRMVKDLLDFTQARLGNGIPVHPRPLDLHAFARLVVEEVQASFPERTIEVRAEGDGRGEWDADRLAQLVTNLVTNALKYSPDDTPVSVRTRGLAEGVELTVHNGGAPIPPESLGRLFAPMQRGSSKTDSSGRSVGLGLYIVRHIVVGHGGTVDVKSSAEEGTTFTVVLPRRPPGSTG
jgi:PAS domain S-box-containing protein